MAGLESARRSLAVPGAPDQNVIRQLVAQSLWTQTFVYNGSPAVNIRLHLHIPALQVQLIGVPPNRDNPSFTETAEATARVDTVITHADGSFSKGGSFEFGLREFETQIPDGTGTFLNFADVDFIGTDGPLFDSFVCNFVGAATLILSLPMSILAYSAPVTRWPISIRSPQKAPLMASSGDTMPSWATPSVWMSSAATWPSRSRLRTPTPRPRRAHALSCCQGWQAWLHGAGGRCTPVVRPSNSKAVSLIICLDRHIRYAVYKRVESAFAIIAEPNRRAILSLLASSERSVGEIERQLRMPQPSVSKHLRVLREAGFVEARVDAQRRVYRIRA